MEKLSLKILCITFSVSLLLGCGMTWRKDITQKEKKPQVVKKIPVQPKAVKVDPVVETTEEPKSAEEVPPLKVGVILGPGGMRSFAHTGVLRELLNAQIPIDSIVGMEWGALIGGMFAIKGQIHDTEWKLYKLQKKDLVGKKSFFGSKADPIDVDRLKAFTDKNFGEIRFDKMEIDFACPSLSVWSGVIQWQNRGPLKRALDRCWPYPPVFKPKGDWVAAAFALPEAVAYLKSHGMELIIFVNIMDVGDLMTSEELTQDYKSSIMWQELRRSLKDTKDLGIEVIHVKTRKFKLYDFDSRRPLVMAGELAGRRAAEALVQKYGF